MLALALLPLTQTWYSTARGCPRARAAPAALNSSLDGCRDGEATLAAVRCCSPRGAGVRCISVCGDDSTGAGAQPSRSAPKTCIEAFAATASQAHAECKAQGMRICRLEELSACCKSGCGLDVERVWTADSCQPTPTDLGRQRAEAVEAQALSARLQETRLRCGPLCNTSRPVFRGADNLPFGTTTAPLECDALYAMADEASAGEARRPLLRSELPSRWIIEAYTMGGRYPLFPGQGMSQQYLGKTAMSPHWHASTVKSMVAQARRRALPGNYGVDETNRLLDGLERAQLRGRTVLVIGSENPWVEAACLASGAAHVTTLEYGRITTDHPKLSTYTPSEFRHRRQEGKLPSFGAIVTFSSVEHSGLGRYGDALNPWGDLIAIARAWCVAATDAKLVIGVMSGDDRIEWNAHRRYGRLRYPYLATNWQLEWASPTGKQRVHVFGRIDAKAPLHAPLLDPEPHKASGHCDANRELVAPVAAAADSRWQGTTLEPDAGVPSAISIAIATCRRASHLKRVLPIHLRHSRVTDVVVTDDCATDARELTAWAASGAVSPTEAAKLKVVSNERQLWPFANKYAAVKHTRGPWVAVLDSDNTFLPSYFETLFELWKRVPPNPKIIYAPQRLLRPKPGLDGHLAPHLGIGFDFSSLVGEVCDANTWTTCAKSAANAVLNAGNNVVHRQTALRAWRPHLEHPDMSAKDVWLDSQLMNRLMVERGCQLRVVPNLEYVHPASADSFYKRGKTDPASQRWFRNANLKSVDRERSAVGAAEKDAEAVWSTFQRAAVRCCKMPERQSEARCMSVCEADQRINVAGGHDTVWEPKLGTDGLSATPVAAAAECSARGWRLCKRAELRACCKKGCGMDKLYVWTADGGAAIGCERGGE